MPSLSLERTYSGIPEVERGKAFNIKADPNGEKLIYGVSKSVMIRDIKNPGDCLEVKHHAKNVTCAAFSPSGFYVCSGDATGKIKIWDTVNEEHLVKYEYQVLAGPINDIHWSPDSKKLTIVGDGRGKFGVVIAWDTGTSVGTITGPTKRLLTCDFKSTRPFSVVVGGEDMHITQYNGPPFKYNTTFATHTNFVNCVRYSTNGDQVASCGQDGKIIVYDSINMDTSFELVHENGKAHNGGIYAISWSPDSKYLLSASGDRTCKIWNIEEKKCETVFTMGKGLCDQQLGCIWTHDQLVSVSLSGRINFLNKQTPDHPLHSFWGHNKSIVCMIASDDKQQLFTSSFDGIINCWDVKTGECIIVEGSTFKSQVSSMSIYKNHLGACGFDDKLRFVLVSEKKFIDKPAISLPSQPQKVVMVKENIAVIGCVFEIIVMIDGAHGCSVTTDFELKGLEVRSDSDETSFTILAGGSTKKVMFYKLKGNSLTLDTSKTPVSLIHEITYIKMSPDGKSFAVCTANKLVVLYDYESLEKIAEWAGHSNRVTCVTWREDSEYMATCGVDGNINIFSKTAHSWRIEKRNAHLASTIPSIVWLKDDVIATVAQQDYCIKFWKVSI